MLHLVVLAGSSKVHTAVQKEGLHTYSLLLGGCYVYDGSVNLLHTQVSSVNCGYIWSASWAKAFHKVLTRTT